MSWRDRDYSQGDTGGSTLSRAAWWLLSGSAPLGTWFGIRVRVHASLIVLLGLLLLIEGMRGAYVAHALTAGVILFLSVLAHEFGHCFAARGMGGTADEILLWPLGGLATVDAPRRPWPTFVTTAGGPLVNVLVCLLCVGLVWGLGMSYRLTPWNLLGLDPPALFGSRLLPMVLGWVYVINYGLLLFNLLPVFPLDGGRIVQTILWPRMGYYRSMIVACVTGMIGAAAMIVFGLLTFGRGGAFVLLVGINGLMTCYQQRALLREMGPEGLGDEADYSASLWNEPAAPRRRHLSRRAMRRARKLALREQAEEHRIDEILAKVSAQGISSLSWWEKRALHKATERERQRDMQFSRER